MKTNAFLVSLVKMTDGPRIPRKSQRAGTAARVDHGGGPA